MEYNKFLQAVIDGGIIAATKDYPDDATKLSGSIAGFNACRDKAPQELYELYKQSGEYLKEHYENKGRTQKYWWHRCYQAEVSWVCNVVSAALVAGGEKPILHYFPTAHGILRAAKILQDERVNTKDKA